MGKLSGNINTCRTVFYGRVLMGKLGNVPLLIEHCYGQIKSLDHLFLDNL